MRTLCVVILNYGTPALTIASAESALADLKGLDGELVIVDNASPDDSAARLNAWRAGLAASAPVDLIFSPENTGYSGGNNLGLKAREAEFYVLLNSDTLVRPGAFAALLGEMRGDPKLGVLGPQLIGPNGEILISRFRKPSPLSEFVEATGTDVFYKIFRDKVVPIGHEEDAAPDWIGFPCIMLRGAMVKKIGFLDEGYFMYFEDADYCRRALATGWKIGQRLDARVDHFRGQSSKVESMADSKARLPAYYYASRARYFICAYGQAGYVGANLLWHLGRLVSYLRVLTFRAPARVCAGRGRDIWKGPDYRRLAKAG